MSKYLGIMFRMTKGHRKMYVLSFFLTFLAVLFMLLSAFMGKMVVDTLQDKAPIGFVDIFLTNLFGGQAFLKANLWVFSLIIVGIALARSTLQASKNIMLAAIDTTVMKETQLKLFHHIERLPFGRLKSMKTGDIIQTCTRDEEILRHFLIRQINVIVYTFNAVILSFIILLTINIKIALAAIIILPVLMLYSFLLIKRVRRTFRAVDDSEGLMISKIEENLSAVRLVKAYNNELFEMQDFEKYVDDYTTKTVAHRRLRSFFFASSDILVFGQIAFSLLFGVYLGLKGEITSGTLYLSISFTSMIVWPVRQVSQILANLARAVVSMDRMDLILNEPLEDIHTGITPEIKGHLVFKNVGFHYDDNPEDVLTNINLEVKQGETIAVMGKTGSGKSTFTYLLTRLYDYTEGSVLLDGFELKTIQREHLRHHVASVLQEPFLFSKTILSNLKVANANASDADIERATRIADIHETITKFNKGYDTPVGEKGVTLSGGQKQRLAIARTIINSTPILIFDDSLSAVDTETDLNIRSALKEKAKNTTTFIITHRVATAKDADRIIVFEDNKIAQCGTHDQLIKEDGLYKRVYDIQTRIL